MLERPGRFNADVEKFLVEGDTDGRTQ